MKIPTFNLSKKTFVLGQLEGIKHKATSDHTAYL
jgi:hypothetical protein